ncbi:MAG: U32 family peptidase [Defluviitaleaceae bacterium]|nr:U32 family peptidase [Defluviitaleaceae bacterium]
MKPELLAPCGNIKTLKAAVQSGADAVYFGAGKFSARAFAGNFEGEELQRAIEFATKFNVKSYLAINTLVTDREIDEALAIVKFAYSVGVGAFIVQDLGLASAIKETYPDAVLHASTQTTAQSPEDVNTLANLGFKRVVLARELSRKQIKKISANTKAELEVFVHGALCSAYSGQCLMSSFIGGRSANRGKCAQPCRLPYKSSKSEGVLLSLKDLCLINYISEFKEMGISSLKIEGRMKGEAYVRAVVSAYRLVIDGGELPANQKSKILEVFNRGGYTDGYFTGDKSKMYMKTLKNPYGAK